MSIERPTSKGWFAWRRALPAIVVGELVPILTLVAAIALWGPSDPGAAASFARRSGMWIGPIAGALTIFLVAAWAGRASARPVLQGAAIGMILALLDVAILAGSGESFAFVFLVSNVGKVLAGALGGRVAAKRDLP